MAQSLAQQIATVPGQPSSVRIGTVESVNPIVVSIQGTQFANVGVVAAYYPQVGDVVAVLGGLGSPTAQAGSEVISFSALTSFTTPVVFDRQFSRQPSVSTNINNATASTAGWQSRAFGVTTSGFTLFVFGASSTWTNIDVQWQAQIQTQ
jgi:hypothetical protein